MINYTSPNTQDKKYVVRKYPLQRLLRICLFSFAKIIPISGYIRTKIYRLAGVDIEKGKSRCGVIQFDTLHPEDIHIGCGCEIVNGCTILSHFYDVYEIHSHAHLRGGIRIGRNVYMGTNTIITKPVSIGSGAVIGAGSVVTKDIPPYQVWAGVPAKFIKNRFSESNPIPESTEDFI
jgi:acetyltransferase-like isoleucine patch superfamily enzyme